MLVVFFLWEGGEEREREVFSIDLTVDLRLIDYRFKNRTILKSTINQSSEDRRSHRQLDQKWPYLFLAVTDNG